MAASVTLDHLAIGVARWPDAYERFAADLGGQWSHGGDAGDFAPYQLIYRHGMRLEFIAPGAPDGFMHRFIDRDGPGAHHITFKVPSLDQALAEVAELGIEPLGGRTNMPFWQEAFLHPKFCGVGTLLQIVQTDEEFMATQLKDAPPPAGFPTTQRAQRGISWVALTARSLDGARSLFVDVLHGAVVDSGEHWMLLGWGNGRSLLVRDAAATPGGSELWPVSPQPGVAHVMIGPPDLRPQQLSDGEVTAEALPYEDRTRVAVWIAPDPAVPV